MNTIRRAYDYKQFVCKGTVRLAMVSYITHRALGKGVTISSMLLTCVISNMSNALNNKFHMIGRLKTVVKDNEVNLERDQNDVLGKTSVPSYTKSKKYRSAPYSSLTRRSPASSRWCSSLPTAAPSTRARLRRRRTSPEHRARISPSPSPALLQVAALVARLWLETRSRPRSVEPD